jgi:dihydroxyacetone kinase-like protein
MIMKKFINTPENLAEELNTGLVRAHSDLLQMKDNGIIIRKKPKAKGKVQIVFGQGSGHEPGLNGLMGYGMHDVEVPGGIFACAGGDRIYEGIKLAWEMSGHTPVLVLIANHEGDVINNGIAVDMARDEDIDVESVLLYDDIASAPKGQEENRRGMGGMVFSFKIAGALAEEGRSRDEVAEMTRKTTADTRTIAVAMKPCTHPQTGQPLFDLADDELIIGPGVHGEAGPEGPMKLITANAVMDIVANRVIEDGEFKKGEDVLVLINGTGSTTLMEMFLLYSRLEDILNERGIKPFRPLVGNYITTQEMAGFSLSLCRADKEIKRLWSAPANTPYLKVFPD